MPASRFEKKLPNPAHEFPVSDLIVALLRLRCDQSMDENKLFLRITKRLTHTWCQCLESTLKPLLETSCPDPTISAKYHPYHRSSRAKGNKSLMLNVVGKWQARSAGYVTLKSEDSLRKLNLVSENSKFGSRTAMEYVTRMLTKTASFLQQCCHEGERTLNFAFDCAMVGEESATGR